MNVVLDSWLSFLVTVEMQRLTGQTPEIVKPYILKCSVLNPNGS
jgi:hypothetical protein